MRLDQQELLDRERGLVDLAMLLDGDLRKLFADVDLLGGELVLVARADVVQRDVVVVSRAEFHLRQNLIWVPGAVIQIQEDHVVGVLVSEEDVGRVEVGVDDVFIVQELEEVDDLDHDLDRLVLAEQGSLAAVEVGLVYALIQHAHVVYLLVVAPNLLSRIHFHVFAAHADVWRLVLLDRLRGVRPFNELSPELLKGEGVDAGLIIAGALLPPENSVVDVILEGHALYLLDFSEDYFVRQLAKRLNLLHAVVVEVVHKQGFTPDVVEQVVLLEHRVVEEVHVEEVRLIFCWGWLLLLENCLCFHSESVIEVSEEHVVELLVPPAVKESSLVIPIFAARCLLDLHVCLQNSFALHLVEDRQLLVKIHHWA